MITFGIVCIVLGVILFILALPRNLAKIELEAANIKANLPEITGWSRIAVFILGTMLIVLGLLIGVLELFRSASIPNLSMASTTPTAVPVLTSTLASVAPTVIDTISPAAVDTSSPVSETVPNLQTAPVPLDTPTSPPTSRLTNPISTFTPEVTNTDTPLLTATSVTLATSTATPELPTATPILVAPANAFAPKPYWLSETGGIPETGNEYSIDLLPEQTLLFTGGEFQYQNMFCGGGASNICILVYKATKPQTVKLTKLYPASNYAGVSDTYTPEQALTQKVPQFWQSPNCGEGCTTAVVHYIEDGRIVRKQTLSVNQ
jgi:hypothetical protein